MNRGQCILAADGQSLQVCGAQFIYTLRIGETCTAKLRGVAGRNSVRVDGFVPSGDSYMVLYSFSHIASKIKSARLPSATPATAFILRYVCATEPRNLPRKPRKETAPQADLDLAAKLVAQLVADVADLRARVSSLELGVKMRADWSEKKGGQL